jgi:ABC-2 type transport system ATP-binding protein
MKDAFPQAARAVCLHFPYSASTSEAKANPVNPIVEIQELTKIYEGKQRVVALDGVDLDVKPGELFGLLGPNGAGKTTTISIATTRALPTKGSVRIAGVDAVAHPALARRSIGVVPQYNTLDRSLTVYENLLFHCAYFGMSRSESIRRTRELLKQFLLEERAKSYPNQLSGGLQQRVQIARAIAHKPAILFLDEPSAGLDPQSRLAMWEAIRNLRKEGITVLLTTHYMEEADALCERIAIIDQGRVLALGSPLKLKQTFGVFTFFQLTVREGEDLDLLGRKIAALPGIESAQTYGSGVRAFAQSSEGLLPAIVEAAQGFNLRDISVNEPSLESVFIKLTGRDLRE